MVSLAWFEIKMNLDIRTVLFCLCKYIYFSSLISDALRKHVRETGGGSLNFQCLSISVRNVF